MKLSEKMAAGAILALFLITESAIAIHVGTPGLINQGVDAFGTPVGVYGAVNVGRNEESGSTLSDLVGQGGNAITINMSDQLAQVADRFTMSAAGCSGAGTQIVNLNASTAQQVCSQLNALNQGCSWRGGGTMDIVGPFLCTITHWEFLTGVVPALATTVNITGVTDIEAGTVDDFRMFHGGTQIQSSAGTFNSVSNGSQLAAAISGLSGLINASYAGTTLTITATSTGPTAFSGLRLEFITPPTTTSWAVDNLDDTVAAYVNQFTLNLNSIPVNQSGVDFSTVSDLTGLAAELNGVPGIDVVTTGPDEITIAASSPGNVVFGNLGLRAVAVLGTSGGTAQYLENGSAETVDPALSAIFAPPVNLTNAYITVVPFSMGMDQLAFAPVGGIQGSFSAGALNLTGSASVSDYRTALRSVSFSSSNDDPPASVTISFRVSDGFHFSNLVTRDVEIVASNDPPQVSVTAADLNYNEDDSTPVDDALLLQDPDNIDLQSATVAISSGFVDFEDLLEFVDGAGISGSFVAGTLTLTGPASVTAFETAMRGVAYRNLSDTPAESPRTVSFSVNDGVAGSGIESRTIQVNAVNDPPLITTTPGTPEYPTMQRLAVDAGLIVSDPDSMLIQGGEVSILAGFVEGDDWLWFIDQNGITGFYDEIAGTLELVGAASVADYTTALRSVEYQNSNPYPGQVPRTIWLQLDDGTDLSNLASCVIQMPVFVDGFENQP